MIRTTRQTLLIDADDTLWENNFYFARAIAQLIEHASPLKLSTEEIRQRLDDEEWKMKRSTVRKASASRWSDSTR